MAPTLPRFIVLKHQRNNKYLIHLRDDKDRLQFSGTEFESQNVKFEVVPSSTKGSELVHLKCCYNNRYWVVRPNQYFVSADAFETEEDQSKPLCTLFKPVFFTSNRIGFYHVYHKSNVMFNDPRPFYLAVYPNETVIPNQGDYLDFEDWETLPILPKLFALKGVGSGNYLNTYSEETRLQMPWAAGLIVVDPTGGALLFNDEFRKQVLAPGNVFLRFNCKDKGEQGVANEVFKNSDGTIRIKNFLTQRFWRRSPNWIWPDSSDETNNNPDTLFKVVKLAHNRIALKNLGNDKYCESLSVDGKHDCLNANTTTIPGTAQFMVEELVSSREIYNVRFHNTNDSNVRVHKKEILHLVKMTDTNNTSVTQESTLDFDYEHVESEEWKLSTSTKLSVETQITFGPPDVVQGNIKLGAEVTKEVSEGKTKAIKKTEKYAKKIYVPPKSKVAVNFHVTQAICDIPYSYSVREVLTNGLIVLGHNRDDGLYTSIQTFVDFNAKEVPAE